MKFVNGKGEFQKHLQTSFLLPKDGGNNDNMLRHTVPYKNQCIERNKSSFDPKLSFDDICKKLEGLLDEYVPISKVRRIQYGWYTVYMKRVGRQYYNYLGRDGKKTNRV